MSVIKPNETAKSWRTNKDEAAVQLYVSGAEGDAAALVGTRVAGFPLSLNLVASTSTIPADELAGSAAAVVQVDAGNPASVTRFEKLARATSTPLIAAAYDPPLALVRALVRAGAHDVVPLPLDIVELEASLAPIRDERSRQLARDATSRAKLVSIVKSVGGVGATALLNQVAIRFAHKEAAQGRSACLIDFDVQFGDAAFQLGLKPSLSLADLVAAGNRLDGDLLRATTTEHPSGLQVIASPPNMMPLEALTSEQAIEIVDLARRELGTVFVDLPSNWTNWSLSLLARSDLVLLVTEMTVASLHRARRQLLLLEEQELEDLEVRVVVNRQEKGLFKTIKPADVRNALGRDVSYTIANDFPLMSTAIDRGVPVAELKRKSALSKDIDTLEAGIAGAFGLER